MEHVTKCKYLGYLKTTDWFMVYVNSQSTTGDLRLSGPPSGRSAGGGARTRDRRVPADLKSDSLATVPPMSPITPDGRCTMK
ncbi:hypothetical protein PoB_002019400 [Plakobranchus ocellatus]|uniref:Uncharacterized protein n=1 Tax=Plakobranchus ocellatus TaxID=259542 RepID=A0AAV3ZE87_9GAST|nr:hypothetical protein PoB_002019400 [Plakobranchus ocellatus]